MHKKNRIIVLLDLSETSEYIIRFAYDLSEGMKSNVVFIHQIVGRTPSLIDKETKYEIQRKEIDEAIDVMIKLGNGRIQHDNSIVVSHKSIPTMLNELQSEYYNDWVLGGLKSGSMLKRILFGTTILSVINDTDLITVAVPTGKPISVPHKLMVGVTHTFPFNTFQFNTLLSSFASLIHEIIFFTILDEDTDETQATDFLNGLEAAYKVYNASSFKLQGKDKFNILKEHATQIEHSFLVLQQGPRSIMDDLFRKFMINELVYNVQVPLIVLTK